MRGKHITIFGASGFIGRSLVQKLASRGAIIRAAVRHPEAAKLLKPLGEVGQITPIYADIRDTQAVRIACSAPCDAVINLVGILYERGKQTFSNIHVVGAANIAEVAKANGIKSLVHLSALGADLESPSKYAQSKARGEHSVRTHFPEAVILRPSVVFGSHDSFFNRFASMLKYSPFFPLIGGGGNKMQPIYVTDQW